MELSAKLVRSQLNFFKPFVANCSLEVTRKGQDKLGELMTALHKREVLVKDHAFAAFRARGSCQRTSGAAASFCISTAAATPAAVWSMPRALPPRWRQSAVFGCSAPPTGWRRRTGRR